MRADLAVDKLEATPRVGNLLAKAGGEFREEVAVLAGRGFSVEVQLGDLSGEKRVPLRLERGDIALGVLDLARDAEKFRSGPFAGDRGVDLAMIVKQTLQRFGIAATIRLVSASH